MFPVHVWISVTDFRCDNFFPIKTALKYDCIVLFTIFFCRLPVKTVAGMDHGFAKKES